MTYDIPGRLVRHHGTVRLREPATADRDALIRALRRGTYGKPFVVEELGLRRLHFGFKYVQGEMAVAQPLALTFAYTQKMMAALLFAPRPRHVLLVGLGAGSLTRFCAHHLRQARITTLEIDRRVIGLRSLFALPRDDARVAVVHADAVAWLAAHRARADVILLDGCDRGGVVEAFRSEGFYRDVRASLAPRGVLAMNLIGKAPQTRAHLALLRAVFGAVLVLRVPSCGNRVAFAFRDRRSLADWPSIEERAVRLKAQTGLNFPAYAAALRRAAAGQAA